jgi:hypothetical protein
LDCGSCPNSKSKIPSEVVMIAPLVLVVKPASFGYNGGD